MTRTRSAALALAAALVAPAVSTAAEGFGVNAQAGYFDMTNARRSAKAVFDGSSGGVTFGGEMTYGFREHVYVAAGVRYFKKDGQRVFVADASGPVFRLGHPLSIRILPVYATLGYRFGTRGSLVPYAGIGGGITSFREESTVGGVTDSQSENKASGHVLAGIEMGQGGLRFGVEARYTLVPNSVGVAGVSKVYSEKDVGGASLVAKIIFTRGR